MTHRPRVLVVEDDAGIRDFSALALKSACDVTTCKNGKEALEEYDTALVQGQPFDLIILDVMLDGGYISGVDVARQIRSHDADVKLVFFTGRDDDILDLSGPFLNVSDVWHKPLDGEDLLFLVQQVLGKPQKSRQLLIDRRHMARNTKIVDSRVHRQIRTVWAVIVALLLVIVVLLVRQNNNIERIQEMQNAVPAEVQDRGESGGE